jgi:hypothetical protein
MAASIEVGLVDSTVREPEPGERTGARPTPPHVDGAESSRQLDGRTAATVERDMASRSGAGEAAVVDLVSSEDDEGSDHDAGERSDHVKLWNRGSVWVT